MHLEEKLLTGIDLVEIGRIRKSMKNPRFCRRILGQEEFLQLQERGFPPQSVAVNFCAKEAFAKAMGTGVRNFSLQEVELLRNEKGKPYLKLHGNARRLAQKDSYHFSVSATHTKEYASVIVIALKEEAQ